MSAILPPSANPAPPTSSAGPVPISVAGDAKALAGLPAGALIEAVAQARPIKGVLEVMTADGPLQLKVLPPATLPPIPEGARLLLQTGPNGGLTLMAVNGRALGGAALTGLPPGVLGGPVLGGGVLGTGPHPTQTAANPAQHGVQSAPPATVQTAAAPGITATLIRPAQNPGAMTSPTATGGLPNNLPAGTQLTVRIAGIQPPQAQSGQNPAANPATNSPPTGGPNPVHAAQQGVQHKPMAPQPMTPGGTAPSLPATATIPSASGAPPILSGTVTAHPPGGQAVLSTSIGTIAVPTAQPVAIGSVIRLEVVAPPNPPAVPPPNVAAAKPEGLTAQGWPALTDTMETLAVNDRQALDMMMRAIPQAGPRLAAAMVAFTGAMRTGDSRGIIGDNTTKALDKAGRRDLAERLKADLSALSEEAGRPVGGGDWRLHTMPFAHGGQVDPIHLFVRGTDGQDARNQAGGANGDQRFILDFNLTSLGRLQLDGLVRREDKLFDLIIRTGDPLPQQMRMDIMHIFTQASELVGTKGSVAFQAGGRWIDIRTDQTGPTSIQA
jgi:hypothetical protein